MEKQIKKHFDFFSEKLFSEIKAVFLCLLVFLCPAFVHADDWILTAVPFSAKASQAELESAEKAATDLPSLILACLEGRGGHLLEESEIERRVRYDLKEERKELFTDLTNEIRARDVIMFNTDSKRQQKKLSKESDKKIEEIRKKISLNLQKASNPLGEDPSVKKNIFAINPKAVYVSDERPGDKLTIRIWQNDSSRLFADKREDENFYDFEKRVLDEHVSGIISGNIVERSGFLSITVELSVFPGGMVTATLNDVGSLEDLPSLAAIMAKELYPYVLNSKPVQLHFEITPEDAAKRARIYIDGALPQNVSEIEVENGKHQIYIYSDGYEAKHFNYAFTETDEFIIQVKMSPKKIANVAFEAQTLNQSLYASGLPVTDPSHVSLEKGVTLGEISSENGLNRFYIVKNKTDRTDSKDDPLTYGTITFQSTMEDYAASIEQRRTGLYNSYALLLFSLPSLFFTKGMSIATRNSVLYHRDDSSAADQWEMYYKYTKGATITLGANFLFQLARYLYTANKILPQTVDVTEKKGGKFHRKNRVELEPYEIEFVDESEDEETEPAAEAETEKSE
ncbi:MAG: hypothetical protein J5505_00585 [Spirochaetaceae bacterium]|nr:hypothetical protein [Spirochaetaceae bacterium]